MICYSTRLHLIRQRDLCIGNYCSVHVRMIFNCLLRRFHQVRLTSSHTSMTKCLNSYFFSVTALKIARDTTSEYVAWGHSTVVDPWGKIVTKANEGEETIVADLGDKNETTRDFPRILCIEIKYFNYNHFRFESNPKGSRPNSSIETTTSRFIRHYIEIQCTKLITKNN